jgi:hypothetical protein
LVVFLAIALAAADPFVGMVLCSARCYLLVVAFVTGDDAHRISLFCEAPEGVGSFEYGWLRENVLSADVVLPGGERREVVEARATSMALNMT